MEEWCKTEVAKIRKLAPEFVILGDPSRTPFRHHLQTGATRCTTNPIVVKVVEWGFVTPEEANRSLTRRRMACAHVQGFGPKAYAPAGFPRLQTSGFGRRPERNIGAAHDAFCKLKTCMFPS